jgi:hypothetical protein
MESTAPITIRPPLGRRIVAAVALIGIGLIALIMVEGGLAVAFGDGGIRQPWGSIVVILVATLEVLGLWRLLTFSLVLDEREARVNNYFRRERVGIADVEAIQMVSLDGGPDELAKTKLEVIRGLIFPKFSYSRGDAIWDLIWPEQQYGAALSLRSRATLLKATATFRGCLNPSVIEALRGWTVRRGITFRENAVNLGPARTSSVRRRE